MLATLEKGRFPFFPKRGGREEKKGAVNPRRGEKKEMNGVYFPRRLRAVLFSRRKRERGAKHLPPTWGRKKRGEREAKRRLCPGQRKKGDFPPRKKESK